ncbi:MAG: hypothetical protein RI911_822 [Candidatus Parcubacteria bacterium]
MGLRSIVIVTLLFAFCSSVSAQSISVRPQNTIQQGEVFQARVSDLPKGVWVTSVDFDGNKTPFYTRFGITRAVRGLPLSAKAGERPITVILNTKQKLLATVTVIPREKPVRALPSIPKSLGGNTVASENTLAKTLGEENKIIASPWSNPKALWYEPFRYPVKNPIVTDVFGYSRQGSSVTVNHKGTDYRAEIGTPVFAMNRGVVRISRNFRNYGNTVVVDHGVGVLTYYMHLKERHVQVGKLVARGERIGLSGDTGYVSAPHLHITVRVNGASIDPEQFLQVMGE